MLRTPLTGLIAEGTLSLQSGGDAYERRVEWVRRTPGLVAFWDVVQREDGVSGAGRLLAHTAKGDAHRYVLEPHSEARGNSRTTRCGLVCGRVCVRQHDNPISPALRTALWSLMRTDREKQFSLEAIMFQNR